MADQVQDFFKNLAFSYIDGIALVWLVIGLLRGRKHGMTQELLPACKWTAIVLAAGYLNQPLGVFIYQITAGKFDAVWSGIAAYAVIAVVLSLLFALLNYWTGDKLTGSDVFGRYEYYLGMLAGLARFACLLIVPLAIMHARIVTQAEMDAIDAQMKKNKDDIHPLRYIYGGFEQAVFTRSFTGKFVQEDLPDLLIPTVTPQERPAGDSLKKKLQDAIDTSLGPGKK